MLNTDMRHLEEGVFGKNDTIAIFKKEFLVVNTVFQKCRSEVGNGCNLSRSVQEQGSRFVWKLGLSSF